MRSLKLKRIHILLSLLCLSIFAGCGGGGGETVTTNFAGTVALTGGQTGTLNLTVQTLVAKAPKFSLIREAMAQTTGTVPANGSCILPGQPSIPLSGTFNTSTNAINVSGNDNNGNTFVFNGTTNPTNGGMTGTIQNASGTSIGSFSAVTQNTNNAAALYCGTFSGGDVGVFNVQVDANGNLTGSAQPSDPNKTGVSFVGTVSGGTFTACSDDPNGTKPICGTIQGNNITGFFQQDSSNVGCFVGNTSLCSTGTSTPPTCGAQNCNFGTCP